jgi:hypothetical protein
MSANVVQSTDVVEIQRRNNRRVGIVLALFACTVFATVIFRQWVSGGV